MRNHKLLLAFIIVFFSLASTLTSYAASNPVSLLQYIANNMISGLKANKATLKTKPQIVYNLAYKYVVPHADLNEMAKRVLPPQTWNNASPAQRARFQKEFTKTLIRTYASALTAYEDQEVKFYPVRGGYAGQKTVEVNSEIISSNSEPVRVSYRLVNNGGNWRLYDMSVEGVDMLESFRSQFSDILGQGGIDQLIARMSSHNNRR